MWCELDGIVEEMVKLGASYKDTLLRRRSCMRWASAIDPSIDMLVVHCDIWMRLIEAVMYVCFR